MWRICNDGDEEIDDTDDDESLKGGWFHLSRAGVNDMKSFVILEEF